MSQRVKRAERRRRQEARRLAWEAYEREAPERIVAWMNAQVCQMQAALDIADRINNAPGAGEK